MLNLNKIAVFKKEFIANIKLMIPIYCSQTSFIILSVADNILVGNYSSYDLAAIALGSSIWIPISNVCEGILRASVPIVSSKIGKGDKEGAIDVIHDIIFIAIIIGILSIFILNNSDILFNIVNAPQYIVKLTKEYLQIIFFSLPIMCLYQGMRVFCEGYGKTNLIMIVSLIGISINIPINYILVYGKFGFPVMGAIGCSWALFISICFMCLCLFVDLYLCSVLKLQKLLRRIFIPNYSSVIFLLKLGIPIGINALIDSVAISFAILVLSPLGEIVISSYEIALNISYVMIMIPQSLSIALTIRLSKKIGTKKYNEATFLKIVGIIQTFILSLILVILLVFNSNIVVNVYSQDTFLIKSVILLIPVIATLHILESFQIILNGILYVYNDNFYTLIVFVLSYFVIGLPLGYSLSMTNYIVEPMAAKGCLYGIIIGVLFSILLSSLRVYKNIKIKTQQLELY